MSSSSEPVAVEQGPVGPTLVLRGRVTVEQARLLHECAAELRLGGGPVTVDCAAVERLDAAAVQVLLALRTALGDAGRSMALVHVPAALDATLRLAGVCARLGVEAPAAAPGEDGQ